MSIKALSCDLLILLLLIVPLSAGCSTEPGFREPYPLPPPYIYIPPPNIKLPKPYNPGVPDYISHPPLPQPPPYIPPQPPVVPPPYIP